MSVQGTLECRAEFAEHPDTLDCDDSHESAIEGLVAQVDVAMEGLRQQLATDIQPADITVRSAPRGYRPNALIAGIERWAW